MATIPQTSATLTPALIVNIHRDGRIAATYSLLKLRLAVSLNNTNLPDATLRVCLLSEDPQEKRMYPNAKFSIQKLGFPEIRIRLTYTVGLPLVALIRDHKYVGPTKCFTQRSPELAILSFVLSSKMLAWVTADGKLLTQGKQFDDSIWSMINRMNTVRPLMPRRDMHDQLELLILLGLCGLKSLKGLEPNTEHLSAQRRPRGELSAGFEMDPQGRIFGHLASEGTPEQSIRAAPQTNDSTTACHSARTTRIWLRNRDQKGFKVPAEIAIFHGKTLVATYDLASLETRVAHVEVQPTIGCLTAVSLGSDRYKDATYTIEAGTIQLRIRDMPHLVARLKDGNLDIRWQPGGSEATEVLYEGKHGPLLAPFGDTEFYILKKQCNELEATSPLAWMIRGNTEIFRGHLRTMFDDAMWERLEPKLNALETGCHLSREQWSNRVYQLFFLGLAALRMSRVQPPTTGFLEERLTSTSIEDSGPASLESPLIGPLLTF
ncbi:hypothetical protein C8R47DRAFT_1231573 [Mycena vitilis]|nr:hypothetical protein C8R47DRAFT_1231573 [Mycena vitilis]